MHVAVADAVAESDPLLACRHYIEAGRQEEAMACLGRSVMLTMGSGQWGIASSLVERLDGVSEQIPPWLAIQARRLIDDGELDESSSQSCPKWTCRSVLPDARAVFRHTQAVSGLEVWRSRVDVHDSSREFRPTIRRRPFMREIAQIFVDASPLRGPS